MVVSHDQRRTPAGGFDFQHRYPGGLCRIVNDRCVSLEPRDTKTRQWLKTLNPHGLDIAASRLYVVDRRPREHVISEVALYPDGSAGLLRSFGEGYLIAPNDVAIDQTGTIWVSDSERWRGNRWLQAIGLNRGRLWRIDPGEVANPTAVCTGLLYPNGIVATPDGIHLALSQADALLRFFPGLGCRLVASLKLPDNLSLAEDGRTILAASHSSRYDYLLHRRDLNHFADTELLAVSNGTVRSLGRVSQLHPQGAVAAASSVLELGDFLYIGQVFGNGILRCRRQ